MYKKHGAKASIKKFFVMQKAETVFSLMCERVHQRRTLMACCFVLCTDFLFLFNELHFVLSRV